MTVPQGQFTLARYPVRKRDSRRAWDAADEYLLINLAETTGRGIDASATVVVVNDSAGAVAVALADLHPWSYGDSYVSHRATEENLDRNGFDRSTVRLAASLDDLPTRIDLLVVKVPKSLALLEFQLERLAASIHPGTVIVAGAMTKHVHNSTLEAFERWIGPTTTSLARRKARLIYAEPRPEPASVSTVEPSTFMLNPGGLRICNYPGVFSSERLDSGTSFFLDNLPDQAGQIKIVDLGCGNGVVGLVAAIDNPDAELVFVDESYLAVASAEATFVGQFGNERGGEFIVGNSLGELQGQGTVEHGSVDLVFNNPPFHDDHALSDAVAWQMFTDSHSALKKGGQLWVVGNRNLAYHAKLKRIFGNCDVVGSNSKFVVFRAERR